jgi:hypothetical protein
LPQSFSLSLSLSPTLFFSETISFSLVLARFFCLHLSPSLCLFLSDRTHHHITGKCFFSSYILLFNDQKCFSVLIWIWFGIYSLLCVMNLWLIRFKFPNWWIWERHAARPNHDQARFSFLFAS